MVEYIDSKSNAVLFFHSVALNFSRGGEIKVKFLIDNVPVFELLDFALRILAAMVCGAIIG